MLLLAAGLLLEVNGLPVEENTGRTGGEQKEIGLVKLGPEH